MGSLAAAKLSTLDPSVNVRKILSFVFDSKVGLMHTGTWGGKEVNGLMSGFSTEPPDQVYSMESMVVLPYVLPILRYPAGIRERYSEVRTEHASQPPILLLRLSSKAEPKSS